MSTPVIPYRKKRSVKTSLPFSSEARSIMRLIYKKLSSLVQMEFSSPLDGGFRLLFGEFLELVEKYQRAMTAPSEYVVYCSRGCSACCCHWVEDINSFEAEIIVDFLRREHPGRIPKIIMQCEADCREIERLEKIVDTKLKEHNVKPDRYKLDPIDLLLHVFYGMKRPCPLLAEDGSCSVYDVRPLTCRLYVSFSDPLRCDPEYMDFSDVSTCIIDFSESVNRLLDSLHFRYLRFEGDTGLRSLLLKYLSADAEI